MSDALEARDGGEAPVTAEEIREGTILTVGVSSVVLREDTPAAGDVVAASIRAPAEAAGGVPEIVDTLATERRRNLAFESLGHVLLLDFDDGMDYIEVRQQAARFDGVTAVLESSPGSYHVWNLSVDGLDEQVLTALRAGSDPMHCQQSLRRGRLIVRCAPKWRVDDEGRPIEEYKAAPQVLDLWATETDVPQSAPHLQLLAARAEEQGVEIDVDPDVLNGGLVGEQVIRSEYLTMDDATKRRGL